MPTFRVTDPQSGRVLRLTGDSSPTEEELEQIFSSLPQKEAPQQDFAQQLAAEVGPLEAAAIGAGRGLTTIGRGLGLAEPEDPATAQAIAALKEQRPIVTGAGEIAGEAAPFLLPGAGLGAIAGIGARAAATGALGAAEGVLIARGQDATAEEQAITGGIGGVAAGVAELVLPRIGRIGGELIRRVLKKAPEDAVVDAAGVPSTELQQALSESGQTFEDLTQQAQAELRGQAVEPADAARKAFLESQGLTPTRAQVTRGAEDFQLQQEAAKTSGRVRAALEGQEAILTSRFDNQILETGGQVAGDVSTPTEAIVNKASVLDAEIGELYKQAREAAPGEQNVRFNALTKKLRDLAPSNRRAGGNIEAVVGDMQAKGILDSNMKIIGKVDVETAEDLRKLTNELFDAQNPFGNAKLREIKNALDDDVFRAAGGDVFKQARASKAKFERDLSRAGLSKFDSRKANLVRDVLENKINPDAFVNDTVFSKKWRSEDIAQLKKYLLTGTPIQKAEGRQAWNDLRAETLDTIKNRAFIGPEDAAGNKALSRDKLQKAIQSIGNAKLKLIFEPKELKFFQDMLQVAKLREPVRGTALGRGPSAQAIKSLERRLADIPVLGALINVVDFDAQGRAVLKGSAAPRVRALPSTAPISQIAGAVAVAPLIEEEQ